jgi:aspartyl-tRNA(Asn)/glutamyl-tRNA(Gln) amidotransferase subunit A
VPGGLDGDGLPLGLQLIGKPFDEETVIAAAAAIEARAEFDNSPAARGGQGG